MTPSTTSYVPHLESSREIRLLIEMTGVQKLIVASKSINSPSSLSLTDLSVMAHRRGFIFSQNISGSLLNGAFEEALKKRFVYIGPLYSTSVCVRKNEKGKRVKTWVKKTRERYVGTDEEKKTWEKGSI